MHRWPLILMLMADAALSACTVGPDYRRPAVVTPPAFKEAKGWVPAQVLSRQFSPRPRTFLRGWGNPDDEPASSRRVRVRPVGVIDGRGAAGSRPQSPRAGRSIRGAI